MQVEKTERSAAKVALVRTAILRPVVEAFRQEGRDVSKALQPHGISEAQISDPNAFVRHDTVYAVYNALAEHSRHDFCASVGQTIEWRAFVPFADRLGEAFTLGDFFTRFTSAVSKETNAVGITFLVEDDHAYFSAKRRFRPRVSPAQVDAFQIAVWVSLLHRVLDFRWDPAMLIVRLSDPTALPAEFHGVKPIGCDMQGFSIRLPAGWLSHRMAPDLLDPVTGPDVGRDLSAPLDFLASVENVIRPMIGTRDISVEIAARECGYGPDSLNRRLRKYETTISAVISRLRRDEAERSLMEGEETVGQISVRLGFSDATAFTRAFRKWTGTSPTKYRQGNRTETRS